MHWIIFIINDGFGFLVADKKVSIYLVEKSDHAW